MKVAFLLIANLIGAATLLHAQNRFPPAGAVTIGTPKAEKSAILEVKSHHKGILIPRMTDNQRRSINDPATGLLVFQTNGDEGLYYFKSGWKHVGGGSPLAGANRRLSNLIANPQINVNLTPDQKNMRDLGAEQFEWKDLHMEGDIFMANGGRFLTAAHGANVFLGFGAGENTTEGSTNVGLGNATLTQNISGSSNTAVGWQALHNNVSGNGNTAVGLNALTSNNANGNTAVGYNAMGLNQSGIANIAVGEDALWNNVSGSFNIGMGYLSLFNNTEGTYNLALGISALGRNTTGNGNTSVGNLSLLDVHTDNNTALGFMSGYFNQEPQLCTFVGSLADANDFVTNSVAIGFQTRVLESNQVMVGNTAITSIGGFANWTNFSDGRYKKDVKEEVPGIEFINKLRPVTYTLNIEGVNREINMARTKSDKGLGDIKNGNNHLKLMNAAVSESELASIAGKSKIVYTGFIAQEVEEAARKLNYDFSGVDAPKDKNGFYGLRYGDFVVPLVKAVQDLSEENKALEERITKLEEIIERLESGERGSGAKGYLEQGNPNPMVNSSLIKYHVPESSKTANITLADAKGSVVDVFAANKGTGQLTIYRGKLAAGVYTLTLWVDGKVSDAKKVTILG